MDALTTRMCSEFTYTIVPLLWVRYVKEDVAKHSRRNWLSASDHPWRPWEVTIISSQLTHDQRYIGSPPYLPLRKSRG